MSHQSWIKLCFSSISHLCSVMSIGGAFNTITAGMAYGAVWGTDSAYSHSFCPSQDMKTDDSSLENQDQPLLTHSNYEIKLHFFTSFSWILIQFFDSNRIHILSIVISQLKCSFVRKSSFSQAKFEMISLWHSWIFDLFILIMLYQLKSIFLDDLQVFVSMNFFQNFKTISDSFDKNSKIIATTPVQSVAFEYKNRPNVMVHNFFVVVHLCFVILYTNAKPSTAY